eukprot:6204117-Amphidinium_carterae.1
MMAQKDAAQKANKLRTQCRSIIEAAAREGRLSAALTKAREVQGEDQRAPPASTFLAAPEEPVKAPSPMGCSENTCQSLSFA